MSRVAKMPIDLPKGVDYKQDGRTVTVKGGKGDMSLELYPQIEIDQEEQVLNISTKSEDRKVIAMAGTTRALLANMVKGVHEGFEKRLELRGVGYRAQAKGKVVGLTLGFSHPIDYAVPEGVTVETPSQTEIVVTGSDKQKVGQVAADIRAYRPPEPYKGKGVRYLNERVIMKEAKKA
ncbi:MAG: 50S ribosomal protein L6 [Gammaproteobacteria bacterium]